jgi:hypothetical protein
VGSGEARFAKEGRASSSGRRVAELDGCGDSDASGNGSVLQSENVR